MRKLKAFILFLLLTIFVGGGWVYTCLTREATLTIYVVETEMIKGEALPEFSVQVEIEGSERAFVDLEERYMAMELAQDLKELKGIEMQCEADGKSEGEYPIKLNLKPEFKSQIVDGYIGNVRILTNDSILYVKNPVGEWEGDKFKRYDGTYVCGEFVLSKEDTYYFDADGQKVTGWEVIDEKRYYFNKDGILQRNMWKEANGNTYYLNEQGYALTGWQELEGDTYYFNKEGKMQTGKMFLGTTLCTFDAEGKLLSKKATKINPKKPMVALTFDDGPGKYTGKLLKALKKNNAHATFFVLGNNVERYPRLIKRMQKIGCEVGNHSYDHPDLSGLKKKEIKNQIKTTDKLIKKITGSDVTLLRPPYGAISKTMKKTVGKPMILWNIDTLDWKTKDAEMTIEAVMKDVKDGDIILMHDIHKSTVNAAIKLIPMLQEEGFQLVTVSEMAAAKRVEMKKGKKYTDF